MTAAGNDLHVPLVQEAKTYVKLEEGAQFAEHLYARQILWVQAIKYNTATLRKRSLCNEDFHTD